MHKKHKVSDDTKLHRATWRCAHCGRYIEYDEGFSDREDRNDDCSSVLMFCGETHADAFHAPKTPKPDPFMAELNASLRADHDRNLVSHERRFA